MKRKTFRLLAALIAMVFVLIGALVTTSLLNSKNVAIKQAENSLQNMSEKYASTFNDIFSNAQSMVDDMAIVASHNFQVAEYVNDRAAFEDAFEEFNMIVKEVAAESDYPLGIYLTFDPETSNGWDEIWYVVNRDGSLTKMNALEVGTGWVVDNVKDNEYYHKAIKEGVYWSGAEYEFGMKGEVITYAKAVYDQDHRLIGVMGVDILVDDIFTSMKDIDREISGSSVMIDWNDKIVAGAAEVRELPQKKFITASAEIGDRWELILAQPERVAVDSILKTGAAMILMGIFMAIIVLILLLYISKKKVNPIIQEAEEKDAIMINQARQAKMGEMVGNIAHQWKQPLNSMNMALGNLQDDYEQGLLDEEAFRRYMERMHMMVENLAGTVDDFTRFLKPARKTEVFSVKDEIKNIINLMDERIRLHGIKLEITGEDSFIEGYRNEFSQCMFNLLDNARDALMDEPAGCRNIKVQLSGEKGIDGAAYSVIRIYNNGSRIKEEDKAKLFDLYFTTKEEKDGTGIGLYLTRQIVETHFSGNIYFENEDDGVSFFIKIPAVEAGGVDGSDK